MAIAQADLINRINNVLGLLVKQHELLSDDGYDTIFTIIHWKYNTIREWCTTNPKLKTTRGGASHGEQKINCIQALAWWATDFTLRGKHIDLADFDATMMSDFIDEAKFEYEDGEKDPETEKPDNFSHIKWLSWEEMVYTYFTTTKNSRGLPLAYVIRKTLEPP